MANGEDALREAAVASIMSASPDARERWIVAKLMDISETCAKRNCGQTALQKWTPTAIGTALTGALITVLEYVRSK